MEFDLVLEGHAFFAWLQEELDAQQQGLDSATLAEFRQQTGSDLSVVASDTTAREMLVLNHRTAPIARWPGPCACP